jgi:hypothetical protein
VKAVARRLHRLEGQLAPSSEPLRKRFSVMIAPTRRDNIDLEKSSCQRTLCADGSISEHIVLVEGENGREISDSELEAWIETFPAEANPSFRPCRLPPPPKSI